MDACWCACSLSVSGAFFFFQAEDGIRDVAVTGVQTCALPILDLSAFLVAWRTTSLPDREVVDALVHPAHAGPSAALAAALAHAPGSHYWSDEPDGRHLIVTRPLARRWARWWLHARRLPGTLLTPTCARARFSMIAGSCST